MAARFTGSTTTTSLVPGGPDKTRPDSGSAWQYSGSPREPLLRPVTAPKLPDGADAAAGARVDQAHEIVASECDLKREAERHVIDEGSRKPDWNIDRNRPSGRTVHVGRRVEG